MHLGAPYVSCLSAIPWIPHKQTSIGQNNAMHLGAPFFFFSPCANKHLFVRVIPRTSARRDHFRLCSHLISHKSERLLVSLLSIVFSQRLKHVLVSTSSTSSLKPRAHLCESLEHVFDEASSMSSFSPPARLLQSLKHVIFQASSTSLLKPRARHR